MAPTASGKIRQRLGPAKRRVDDKVKEAKNLLAAITEKSPEDFYKLQSLADAIERRIGRVSNVMEEWKSVVEQEQDPDSVEMKNYEAEMEKFEDILLSSDDVRSDLLAKYEQVTRLKKDVTGSSSSQQAAASAQVRSKVKLPNIELPQFEKGTLQWFEFFDIFESVIHENAALDNISKFNYLLSKLRGEAKTLLRGLPITAQNYPVAIDILKEEYQDTQRAIDCHYMLLTKVPPAKTREEMKQTFQKCEMHLRSLEALNEKVDHSHFVALLKSKLPPTVLAELSLHKGDDKWSMSELRSKVRGYLKLYRDVIDNDLDRMAKIDELLHTTEGLVGMDKGGRKAKQMPQCAFCEKEHFTDQCSKYSSLEDRKKLVYSRNVCDVCLSKTHDHLSCKSERTCFFCKVQGKHHRSLCPEKFGAKKGFEKENPGMLATDGEETETGRSSSPDVETEELTADGSEFTTPAMMGTCGMVGSHSGTKAKVCMQLAEGELYRSSDDGKVSSSSSLIFFDCGSGRSYITKNLSRKLGLRPIYHEKLSVNTFGTDIQTDIRTPVVKVHLKLRDGGAMELVLNVVPMITGKIRINEIDKLNLPVPLEDLSLSTEKSYHKELEVLIGNDYYWDFFTGSKIPVSGSCGLYLVESKLGYIVSGCMRAQEEDANTTAALGVQYDFSTDPVMDVSDLWKLETIGIMDSPNITDDEMAIKLFNESVRFENGRYSVSWPKKRETDSLSSNLEMCFGRLKSLVKGLKFATRLQDYHDLILTEKSRGIIEEVAVLDHEVEQSGIYYTPHHAVFTPDKATTKIRKVHDASAKTKKKSHSLNDILYRGPVILEEICSLLMRFRTHKIAIVADIEKAFHQIELQENDRDLVRFLWLRDVAGQVEKANICAYRFVRVPFGVVSSPFLLGATIQHHLNKANSEVAMNIRDNIYVDNVIVGANSAEAANDLYHEAKVLFSQASMNLREWLSNSASFMENVGEKDRASLKDDTTKVLGVKWNVCTDFMEIVTPTIPEPASVVWCKRTILGFLNRIPDILGLFAPTTLLGKLLIQDLWSEKKEWNDRLSEQQEVEWNRIMLCLGKIPDIKLPRYVQTMTNSGYSYKLLTFTDASARAIGAAVYLHVVNQDGVPVGTNLVFAKARLIPKRVLTIPKAELCGTELGIKCMNYVEKSLRIPISGRVLWTDSVCVLYWFASNRKLSRFIENRLKNLRDAENTDFRYVCSEENPADTLTRGADPMELEANRYFVGPSWLQLPATDWPTWNKPVITKETLEELEKESITSAPAVVIKDKPSETHMPWGLQPSDYSNLSKLIRVTAWCNRLRSWARGTRLVGSLKSDELAAARHEWEKAVQNEAFGSEIEKLRTGQKNSLIYQLDLKLDKNGIIRSHHRLENVEMDSKCLYPKLMPKNHPYTRLIILRYHTRVFHARTSHTLSQIRHEFWIPSGRRYVQSVINDCRICRRFHGGPYIYPKFPQLPTSRVNRSNPFRHTGLDYMGPLYVNENGTIGKVWICLFVCMVYRAVRLELVSDCTPEQFLLALRRFIARSRPFEIVLDNASQFKVVKTVIDRAWNSVVANEEVQSYVAGEGITWKFITATSPWKGGFYERLVAIVKNSLRKGLGKACLTNCQLQTILVEVESIVNTRPLVYVGEDVDSSVALTPEHFLNGSWQTGVPELDIDENDNYVPNPEPAEVLMKTWRKGQNHLNGLWTVFQEEYLLNLRERGQFHLKQGRIKGFKAPTTGDVVLVMDSKLPRGSWKMGRIKEIIISDDESVRSAIVELPTPRKHDIHRPINKLCPLETAITDAEPQIPVDNGNATVSEDYDVGNRTIEPNNDAGTNVRPMRVAAKAAMRMFEQLDE